MSTPKVSVCIDVYNYEAFLPEAIESVLEQDFTDFEVIVWHGIYAPKGTPKEALDKLNEALRNSLRDPEVASKFAELGAQVVPEAKQTPAGLRDWLRAEIDKWGPVIRKAGTYAD